MTSRHRVTSEEKYALVVALCAFACVLVAAVIFRIGSFMDVIPVEIAVRISPNALSSIVIGTPPPLYKESAPFHRMTRTVTGPSAIGIPIPVIVQPHDSLQPGMAVSAPSNDSALTSSTEPDRFPYSATDSLILRYPGFRRFALKEQAQRRYAKSKRDSLLDWAKESFAAQMAKYGKIDPSTLNRMAMLQNSTYYGPYHITTPSIGIGIPFSYTDILQQIKSWFEGPPDE